MEDIVGRRGTRNCTIPPLPAIRLRRGSVDEVAREACAAKDAFHLVFIHADTGGRRLEAGLDGRADRYCAAMHDVCKWPAIRCITVSPRHESEAWMLADAHAVTEALGYRGSPRLLDLPMDATAAEWLADPKAVLARAMEAVRGRRRRIDIAHIVPAIANRQSIDKLRLSRSFAAFEGKLLAALADLGAISK